MLYPHVCKGWTARETVPFSKLLVGRQYRLFADLQLNMLNFNTKNLPTLIHNKLSFPYGICEQKIIVI